MQLVQLILPSVATLALGSALLMPHREDNSKRRNEPLKDEAGGTSEPAVTAFEQLVRGRNLTAPLAGVVAPLPDAVDRTHEELQVSSLPKTIDALELTDGSAILEAKDAAPCVNPPEDERPAVGDSNAAESDRIVPLTRHRLRRQTASLAWPSLLDPSRTACGAQERAELLRSIDELATGDVRERILLAALTEESGELRLVALRSLVQSPPVDGAHTFADLLVHGADEERSLAIDALIGIEHRDELVAAFSDRVEAIAAKAIFAYVGTRRRADYVALLADRFERPRQEAILTLLAGALE